MVAKGGTGDHGSSPAPHKTTKSVTREQKKKDAAAEPQDWRQRMFNMANIPEDEQPIMMATLQEAQINSSDAMAAMNAEEIVLESRPVGSEE